MLARPVAALLAALAAAGTAFAQDPVAAPAAAPPEPVPVAAVTPAAPAGLVAVPALTPVYLRIDADLTSKKSKAGDRFPIHIDEDVRVGDVVVIPAGSAGEGEVIHAARSSIGGKGGELLIAARFVRVGDTEVKLRSLALGASGKDRMGAALAFGFVVGGVATIPKNTPAGAKTAEELHLPAAAPAAAVSPAETTTQVETQTQSQ